LRNEAYFGFEGGKFINTGLGFGAEKQHPILLDMMEDYKNIPFILDDGTFDGTTCPQRNTEVFLKHGLVQNNTRQYVNGSLILPSDYLCPVDYSTGKLNQTENTASIHWFSASWQSNDEKACRDERIREFKRIDRIHRVRHLPNFILRWILGNDRYERLKKHLKRG
jgi:hypothetical protein